MSYTGVYINLDRSTERRAAMEQQLSRLRLEDRYQRFPAAEGNTLGVPTKPVERRFPTSEGITHVVSADLTEGEIGCVISHYLACKQHIGSAQYLHIVEDDVLFSTGMHKSISDLLASPLMEKYDVLFLDSSVTALQATVLRDARWLFDRSIVRDANGAIVRVSVTLQSYQATTTSYLAGC